MTKKRNTLTREELYELVWQKPLIKLAEEFGLSDVGLRKICVRHAIPTPKAGYWRKVETGKKVKKESLPETKNKYVQEVEITGYDRPYLKLAKEMSVEVPEQLTSPHPLVVSTRKAFLDKKPSSENRIYPEGKGSLAIHVSRDTLERALIIFDTIIKELEKKEISIEVIARDSSITTIAKKGEGSVSIFIEEIFFRTETIRVESYGEYKDYKFHPSGKLCLTLPSAMWEIKQSWQDGKRHYIEEKLPEILCSIEEAIIKRAESNVKDRLEQEQRELRRQLREKEEKNIKKLKQSILCFETVQRIQNYANELESGDQVDQEWKNWVTEYLTRIKEKGFPIDDLKHYWGDSPYEFGQRAHAYW